jgi:tetratricopeptide (TPR) repeat protein
LKNNGEAIQVGESLLTQAETEGKTDLAAGAADVLGVLYERMDQHEQSLAMYEHLQKIAPNDDVKAWGLYRAGEKLVGLQRLEDAARMFEFAAGNSDDPQFKYQCLLERIRVLRSLGRHEESLRMANEMLDDFRFLQNSKELQFERGLTHFEAGEIQAAEDDFVVVDTTAGRSELGARASFERAKLYEYVKQDYRAARDAYTRAASFPVEEIVSTARKKQAGLTRYLLLVDARMKLDSLIVHGSVSDSLPADSGAAKPPLDLDSLRSAIAANSFELGELFYIDIENPDSAVYWYGQALENIDDSVRTPRIKYILAELALSYPTKQYADGHLMLRSIIEKYPKSLYATRAKIQLGIKLDPSETDNGEILYKKAEARIDSGDYTGAITTLRTIATEYPNSPFASKSAYTIGWLYENRLSQPESALSEYARLLQAYASSPYAAVVRPRIRAIEASRVDSTGISPAKRRELKE